MCDGNHAIIVIGVNDRYRTYMDPPVPSREVLSFDEEQTCRAHIPKGHTTPTLS